MHREKPAHEDPDMEAQLAQLRADMGTVTFRDGFADRVMARLDAASAPSAADDLQRVFLRLVPLAAAAVLVLATMNVFSTRGMPQRLVDRVLGISAVTTVASADALDGDLSSWGQ